MLRVWPLKKKVHTSIRFSSFSSDVFFVLQDPIQDPMGQSPCLLRLLWAGTVSQTLRVSDDRDSSKGYWSRILWNVLLGFAWRWLVVTSGSTVLSTHVLVSYEPFAQWG